MSTITEIARVAGVSSVTVSNVLNGRNQEIRPSAKKRADLIRQIASDLGYRPNAAARAIRLGRFGAIALLTAADGFTRSQTPPKVMDGIHDALSSHGYHLTLNRVADETLSNEAAVPKILQESHSDGLLINYNKTIPAGLTEVLQKFHTPCVWLNSKMSSDCVYLDDFAAGRMAAEKLIEAGHKRIAYLTATFPEPDTGESAHYSEIDRRDGCVAAVAAAGLTPDVVDRSRIGQENFDDTHMRFLTEYLRSDDRPTGVVCYSASGAMLLAIAALQAGLDFPRQLSAVVIDNTGRRHGFTFSTVLAAEADMGRHAVSLLFDKIKDTYRTFPPVSVPPVGYVPGRTCLPH